MNDVMMGELKPKQYMCSQCGAEYRTSDGAVFCCDINTLKQRIEELKAQVSRHESAIKYYESDRDKLGAKLDAVRPYLRHMDWCDAETITADGDCTCGLEQALEKNHE